MTSINQTTLVLAGTLLLSAGFHTNALAFESSSSNVGFLNGISFTRLNFVSATSGDSFSRFNFSDSIVTEVRSLEPQREVDRGKVGKYVEDRYPLLDPEDKSRLTDVLYQAKVADEVLRGRTNSPSMPDEMKIQHGKERERLLQAVHEVENEIAKEYHAQVKPLAYADAVRTFKSLDAVQVFAVSCVLLDDKSMCDLVPQEIKDFGDGDALIGLDRAEVQAVVKLKESPAEIGVAKKLSSFGVDDSSQRLKNYLKGLRANGTDE